MLRIGYHVSIAKSIDLAFDRAKEIGCTSMQIFVSNPREWQVKPIPQRDKHQFVIKSKQFDIDPVVAHMPYLPNLASKSELTYKKSMESLNKTIGICSELRIKYLVTHLGSHRGMGINAGVRNVIEAVNQADENKNVMLLLENTAGHTNSVGSKLDELGEIFDGISRRVGFCLDTCHLFAAGYDVTKEEVLDNIFDELGSENIRLFHLNDSKFELGAHLDRHENIGRGNIGIEGFKRIFGYNKIIDKPFILETPETLPGEISLVKKIAGSS